MDKHKEESFKKTETLFRNGTAFHYPGDAEKQMDQAVCLGALPTLAQACACAYNL